MAEPRKPLARPYLAALVIVRTREPIAGKHEHAAVVTGVSAEDAISAYVIPEEGSPYPVHRLAPLTDAAAVGWLWPRKP